MKTKAKRFTRTITQQENGLYLCQIFDGNKMVVDGVGSENDLKGWSLRWITGLKRQALNAGEEA